MGEIAHRILLAATALNGLHRLSLPGLLTSKLSMRIDEIAVSSSEARSL